MAETDDHMPPPDPVWLTLGILIFAIAAALGPTRSAAFIAALDEQAAGQASRRRVIAIHATDGRRRAVTRSVQVAATFVARIVAELRATGR
jgi:hypothetical protein